MRTRKLIQNGEIVFNGGHAKERHQDISDATLIRTIANTARTRASTFFSEGVARYYIEDALWRSAGVVDRWVASPERCFSFHTERATFSANGNRDKLEITCEDASNAPIGRGYVLLARGYAETVSPAIRVVLLRDKDNPTGFYVATAFPELSAGTAIQTGRVVPAPLTDACKDTYFDRWNRLSTYLKRAYPGAAVTVGCDRNGGYYIRLDHFVAGRGVRLRTYINDTRSFCRIRDEVRVWPVDDYIRRNPEMTRRINYFSKNVVSEKIMPIQERAFAEHDNIKEDAPLLGEVIKDATEGERVL